jgi:hypothetical protein
MNWYYGRSYNLQTTDIRINICLWIHMIAVRPTYQRTFEFILKYELILWPFIQPTNKGRMNSYMYTNSYDGRLYNLSTDIWIHINVWIDIMAVRTTYTQRTYEFIYIHEFLWWLFVQPIKWAFEFILMYELILWPFIQPTNKVHMNSYMYMNSYVSRSYNLSTDVWIHINVWIDIMFVHTT